MSETPIFRKRRAFAPCRPVEISAMKYHCPPLFLVLVLMGLLTSCNTLEQASRHGFESGIYTLRSGKEAPRKVYADVMEDSIAVHAQEAGGFDPQPFLNIPLGDLDSASTGRYTFRKQSMDIDITAILLKYRPPVAGLPGQLQTDFNMALYAGWRHDQYLVRSETDPLGRKRQRISGWGYDLGVFAGPGTTPVGPSSTRGLRAEDYSGMVLQAGVAGFMESNLASFGLAVGFDHLLNRDRRIWIHQGKPWLGLIVGVAL